MTSYLPRFTLRRALIAIALLALFLGWLRPDRAEVRRNEFSSSVTFVPMFPTCRIFMERQVTASFWPDAESLGWGTHYNISFELKD